jgi:hypothetical protein
MRFEVFTVISMKVNLLECDDVWSGGNKHFTVESGSTVLQMSVNLYVDMWCHCPKTDIFVHRHNFVTEMWGFSCEVRTEQLALFIGTAHSQYRLLHLGAKLRKMTISFVMPVCPHGTTRLPLDGFPWDLIFEYFPKIFRKNPSFI